MQRGRQRRDFCTLYTLYTFCVLYIAATLLDAASFAAVSTVTALDSWIFFMMLSPLDGDIIGGIKSGL
ncbi:MAG TPA: hypothetical protein DIW82_00085 [Corynebacterium nuruki]|uniref:Uncharacterized protein n=1 Tax=Corynebacterium nuruki TaxID=1032851 RepID=A0A3D4SVC9_9CORY|nr:hypothetical protein [Corynebacterium nuruki]